MKAGIRQKSPLTPNTRKRKLYIANEITADRAGHLSLLDQVDAIELSLSKLGVLDHVKFQYKPRKSGRN